MGDGRRIKERLWWAMVGLCYCIDNVINLLDEWVDFDATDDVIKLHRR